jgi:hypothetical protein
MDGARPRPDGSRDRPEARKPRGRPLASRESGRASPSGRVEGSNSRRAWFASTPRETGRRHSARLVSSPARSANAASCTK